MLMIRSPRTGPPAQSGLADVQRFRCCLPRSLVHIIVVPCSFLGTITRTAVAMTALHRTASEVTMTRLDIRGSRCNPPFPPRQRQRHHSNASSPSQHFFQLQSRCSTALGSPSRRSSLHITMASLMLPELPTNGHILPCWVRRADQPAVQAFYMYLTRFLTRIPACEPVWVPNRRVWKAPQCQV